MKRSVIAALVLAALAAVPADGAVQVSQSGWQWGNPTPQGNTIRAMDFIAGRGYAIGDDGTALRTDDGGATWTGLATGTSQDLSRIQAVTPDVVVVLGGNGCVVRRSDDGGATFRKMFVLAEVNCPDPVAAAYFVSPQVGYLLLRDGNVLRTTDGGQTFGRGTAIPGTPASAGGGQGAPADAIFTTDAAGIVFLAGGNTAFRTTDAGASWTPEGDVEAGNVQRVRAVDPATFYAFGPDTLLRSTDAGQTWQRRAASGGQTITGISCATLDLCLMTTDRGDRLLRTENGGDSAESITASTAPLYAAGFATPSRAVAAGSGGATAVSDDGGRNYAPVGGDIAGSFQFGLRLGPAPQIAFALGARGQIARTTDNGVTWRAINVATSADMRDTSFSTADEGYALDQRGGLFRTTKRRDLAADRHRHDRRAARGDHERRRRPAGRPARRAPRVRRRGVLARRRARPPRGGRPVRSRRLGDLRLRLDGDRPHHQQRSPLDRVPRPDAPRRPPHAAAAAARPGDDVRIARLRARQLRPRLAHEQRRPPLDRAAGRRHRRGPRPLVRVLELGLRDARQLPGRRRRGLRAAHERRRQALAAAADRERRLPGHGGRDHALPHAGLRAGLDARGGQRRVPQPVHDRQRR